ncbi:MAG: glycerol-3-phosphate 1-O-acyltransferase PlsY [Bacilli bacterium]
MILTNILVAIACIVFGYLFGSISTSIIIGKIFFHKDPRKEGSKNAGGTNSGRLFGKKIGVLVIFLDMIKTLIPVWIAFLFLTYVKAIDGKALIPSAVDMFNGNTEGYIIQWPVYWLTPLGSLIGHCFPLYFGFKGGKGVSNFYGTELSISWGLFLSSGAVFLLTLKAKKYVSLGSIVGSIFGTIVSWVYSILHIFKVIPLQYYFIPMYGQTLYPNYVLSIVLTVMTIIIIIRHISNIKKIKNGTENKITWMK